MKRVNIMVGGPQELIPFDEVVKRQSEPWVATDHGAIVLLQHGIVPEIALGDFDSSTDNDYQLVKDKVKEVQAFPPEKDYTDTQMGVMTALKRFNPDQLSIFGATGGRLDHLLANLFLPLEPRFYDDRDRIQFIDDQNVIDYLKPGHHTIKKIPEMAYLAIVEFTPVTDLNLPDEKYTLSHFDSNRPISWASNEFLGTVNHLSFKSGDIAIIQSKDAPQNRFSNPLKANAKKDADQRFYTKNINHNLDHLDRHSQK